MPLTVSASAGTAERHPVDPCPMGKKKKKKKGAGGESKYRRWSDTSSKRHSWIEQTPGIALSPRRVASHRFARELRAHRGIQERAVFGSKHGEALAAGYLHGGGVHVTGVAM